MGCKAICGGSSAKNSSSIDNNSSKEKIIQGINIQIYYPDKNEKPYQYQYNDPDGRDEAMIKDVMNTITFGKGDQLKPVFDGNFISIYNPQTYRYHYFCHRLLNIAIDNSTNPYMGKIWVPYINGKKQDWDELIENDVKIQLNGTSLVWKLEQYNEKGAIDFKKEQSKQQSTVISAADINIGIQQNNMDQVNGADKIK